MLDLLLDKMYRFLRRAFETVIEIPSSPFFQALKLLKTLIILSLFISILYMKRPLSLLLWASLLENSRMYDLHGYVIISGVMVLIASPSNGTTSGALSGIAYSNPLP
jgi:hypothetical protein